MPANPPSNKRKAPRIKTFSQKAGNIRRLGLQGRYLQLRDTPTPYLVFRTKEGARLQQQQPQQPTADTTTTMDDKSLDESLDDESLDESLDDESLESDMDLISDSDISDDQDDDTNNNKSDKHGKKIVMLCAAAVITTSISQTSPPKKKRGSNRPRTRRQSSMLLQEGIDDGLFRSEYRMSPESFRKLVDLVRDDLEPKDKKRNKKMRKTYLDPETKVMMTLRWLAGGQYVAQCHRNGVSKPTVFKAFHQVIKAINSNPNIGVPKWPTTVEECNVVAHGWSKLSGPSESKGLFTTVIGMIDGILISTKSPTKRETNKPDDFRSGTKKKLV